MTEWHQLALQDGVLRLSAREQKKLQQMHYAFNPEHLQISNPLRLYTSSSSTDMIQQPHVPKLGKQVTRVKHSGVQDIAMNRINTNRCGVVCHYPLEPSTS